MVLMELSLKYEVRAIGNTAEECKENLLKGFQSYLKGYGVSLEEFLNNSQINFEDYNNDIWTLLDEYYGVRIYDITKGYALDWE